MVVVAIKVIGLLDNVQASIQTMATIAVTDQRFKNYLKMKGMQQIEGEINTNIF